DVEITDDEKTQKLDETEETKPEQEVEKTTEEKKDGEVIEENPPVEEEDEQSEELEQDYPIFDPDIDTDKTDMVNLLNHYITQVFPETDQFVDNAVTPVPELKIDINELMSSSEKQIQSEQQLLK